MQTIHRRSAVAVGLGAVASVLVTGSAAAGSSTGTAGSTEGREIAPGVRRIDYSKRESHIQGYKTIALRDLVYQPGASSSNPSMANDMVCHILEGELTVNQGPGMEFVAKRGDVWSCVKGMPENGKNTGTTVAIMRVTDLIA
jgi:hypothetical protein